MIDNPGDIVDHDYGLQVTLNGKTGRRSPVLVPSVPTSVGGSTIIPAATPTPVVQALLAGGHLEQPCP